MTMRVPRSVLLAACAVLTALAYYLVLFTTWGSLYRGTSYRTFVATDAVEVLAAFACLEVVRTEKAVPLRALAGAVGVPLLLVALLTFWYGVRGVV